MPARTLRSQTPKQGFQPCRVRGVKGWSSVCAIADGCDCGRIFKMQRNRSICLVLFLSRCYLCRANAFRTASSSLSGCKKNGWIGRLTDFWRKKVVLSFGGCLMSLRWMMLRFSCQDLSLSKTKRLRGGMVVGSNYPKSEVLVVQNSFRQNVSDSIFNYPVDRFILSPTSAQTTMVICRQVLWMGQSMERRLSFGAMNLLCLRRSP